MFDMLVKTYLVGMGLRLVAVEMSSLFRDATRNCKGHLRLTQSPRQSTPDVETGNQENVTHILFWGNGGLPFHPSNSCVPVIHQKCIHLLSSFSLPNIGIVKDI